MVLRHALFAESRKRQARQREANAAQEDPRRPYTAGTHMLKQPWHFTSMKKELGLCTKRLRLCFSFSSSAGGWRRSISLCSTCAYPRTEPGVQLGLNIDVTYPATDGLHTCWARWLLLKCLPAPQACHGL